MSSRSPIQVFVRTRPSNDFAQDAIKIDENIVHIKRAAAPQIGSRDSNWSFRVNKVLHSVSQDMVYEAVARDLIDSIMQGYNGTILAYGQTGAGKTYTITGGCTDYQTRGMVQRALNQVYQSIESKPEAAITVRISYLEIYNERLYDLLNPENRHEMHVSVSGTGRVTVKGLTTLVAPTEESALNFLFLGNTNRVVGPHALNRNSSRSHCVFTVDIESRTRVDCGSASVNHSRLNFLDLAGSERVKKTGSVGLVLKEAGYINKSLTFLEQVVLALSAKNTHIPYRSCRLTHVLSDSLGGNCKTRVICNISTEKSNLEETISSLKFVTRMMRISTEATVNVQQDPMLLIKKYEREIRALKQELAMHDALAGRSPQNYDDYSEEMTYDLTSKVKKYIEGEIDLDVSNLKMVHEAFKIFRKLCLHFKNEAEDVRGGVQRNAQEMQKPKADETSMESEQNLEVGDLVEEESGFAVGTAPQDARPDGYTSGRVTAKPVEKVEKKGRFQSEEKALEFFKTSVNGKELNAEYEILKQKMKVKKAQVRAISQEVNKCKYKIDELSMKLEECKEDVTETDEDKTIVNEEEYKIILEIKEVKKNYQTTYQNRSMLQSELVYLKGVVKQAQKKFLSEFLSWAQTKVIGIPRKENGDEETLDPAEKFDELFQRNIQDPESLPFERARKTFSELNWKRKGRFQKRMEL